MQTIQLNFNDLNTLNQIHLTKEKLEYYVDFFLQVQKENFPNLPYVKGFDVENKEYIIIQKHNSFTLKSGFFWKNNQLNIGTEIITNKEIDEFELIDQNWSTCKMFGQKNKYTFYKKYVRMMEEKHNTDEYLNLINFIKESGDQSLYLLKEGGLYG